MTSHSLSEFIDQLRRTAVVFPLLDQHPVGTVSIRSYALRNDETKSLAAYTEEQLSLVAIIEDTRHQLEAEIIPDNKKLAEYIHNLEKIFAGYEKDGNYSTRFFTSIQSSLVSFYRLVELYNERDKELATQLHSFLPGGSNGKQNAPGMDADAQYRIRYARLLRKYNNIFTDFLQHELEKKQGKQVITRCEQYLMSLTAMIQKSISLSGRMRKTMDELKNVLLLAQKQVQYN